MLRAAWLGLVGIVLAGLPTSLRADVPYTLVRTISSPSGLSGDHFGWSIADFGDDQHVIVSSPVAPDGSGEAYPRRAAQIAKDGLGGGTESCR